ARLRLCRPHHLLRLHAGDGAGERPCGGLFLPRRGRGRAAETGPAGVAVAIPPRAAAAATICPFVACGSRTRELEALRPQLPTPGRRYMTKLCVLRQGPTKGT